MRDEKLLTFKSFFFILILFNFSANAWIEPSWQEHTKIPLGENRKDLYQFKSELNSVKEQGLKHALIWPVEVTGLLLPIEPLRNILEADDSHPFRKWLSKITGKTIGFTSINDMYSWLGLKPYPEEDDFSKTGIPFPDSYRPDFYMGATLIKNNKALGLTYSCAACHFGEFLGKTIVGLTNKRPRANKYFHLGKKYIPLMPAGIFKMTSGASREEMLLYKRTRENLKSVDSVVPQVLGLDTSLPHVALSLMRRNPDEYATKSKFYQKIPRPNGIRNMIADSKPMPWWTLKYKNRWLSDGSIVQGNPVLTNFLWNEIGRGTDLKELEKWMEDNPKTIRDLTAAVFSTEAPGWLDFFPKKSLNLVKAKKGEVVFNNSCKECHGTYQKGWSLPESDKLSLKEKIKTIKLTYFEDTPIKDIGTDPNRYLATKYFAENLNNLKISKWMKTIVVPQKGYVPPPLNGIFMRYPYLHNNSIPNLCALMQRPSERPTFFIQGPSKNLSDYNQECLGYPVGNNIPKAWYKEKDAYFNADKPGLLNIGHTKAFYEKDGTSKMTNLQKSYLLEYLKTL